MFEAFKDMIKDPNVKNILIFPHILPDGDALGSAIGIKNIIKYYNKKGYIVLNDDIPSNLLFLFDEDKELLTEKDALKLDYEMIIVVDTGEEKLFEDREKLLKPEIPVINIDHHITNQKFGNLNIVDIDSSSTGELVYRMHEELDIPFSVEAAQALYTAITTDTGSFRYSNTRPYTLRASARLMEVGFDFNRLNVEVFQNKSLEKLLLLNKIFETLSLHFNGRCAVVKLTESLKEKLSLSEFDTDGIVEYVRDIKGVEIVVFIKHIDGGGYKVSMRSKNDFDVSKIATYFNGGGHIKAAGFKTKQEIDTLENQLLKVIGENLI